MVGLHSFASKRGTQKAGNGERLVADDLGIQTKTWTTREKSILRIACGIRDASVLPIRVAGDDEAHHFFDVPTAFAEGHCQPVEKCRMAGGLTLGTEVVGGLHQADAKELLPESVYLDASGQWMIGRSEPAGEIDAVTIWVLRQSREDCGCVAGDLFSRLVVQSALHDEAVATLWEVCHHQGGGHGVFDGFATSGQQAALCQQRRDALLRALINTLQPELPHLLSFIGIPSFWFLPTYQCSQRFRDFLHATALILLQPHAVGPCRIGCRLHHAGDAQVIPGHCSIALREGKAGDLCGGFQPHAGGIDFEFDPLASLGQWSHVDLLWRAKSAKANRCFLAPNRTVLPAIAVKLDHDGAWRIRWIKETIHEHLGP